MSVFTVAQGIHSGAAPPSDVLVAGAGSPEVDGTYTYRGTAGGKNYYNLFGQPDNTGNSAIVWGGTEWNITDAVGSVMYDSPEDVEFSWLVEVWSRDAGGDPPPTVTEV